MAMQWQPLQVPLSNGLQQKYDARARPVPALDICRDAQFDELGGLQTRFPFAAMSNAIFGGGTLSNCRRLAVHGDELLCFTIDSLYSWNALLSAWVLRSTHVAVKVTETPRFPTTDDQIDPDRAELNGTIVYTYTIPLTATGATTSFASAVDKATGSTLMPLTEVNPGQGARRTRLVALSTRILLMYVDGGNNVLAYALDPANPAAALAGAPTTVLASAGASSSFDVVRVPAANQAVFAIRTTPTTSHRVGFLTAALAVTIVTKARTCDGPIAVAFEPNLQVVTVVRGNGSNVEGDTLQSPALTDLNSSVVLGTPGTPINQIAAANRSVAVAGAFRCYVFWSSSETAALSSWRTQTNSISTAGVAGSVTNFAVAMAPGSRAFDFNGSVYLWLTFGQNSAVQMDAVLNNLTQAQNAYILFRDDGFICAKAVYEHGGGLQPTTGRLPGVDLVTGTTAYAWCATIKRRATLGTGSTAFASRAPQDVVFTFDSNEARRTARLGQTSYVAAGEVLQYDGVRLTESGFHFYPWYFEVTGAGAGAIVPGTYPYKLTWRWDNSAGEMERSTTATIGIATRNTGLGAGGMSFSGIVGYTPTHKTGGAREIGLEIWRGTVNQPADAPFYLDTSNDPNTASSTGTANHYIFNSPQATTLGAYRDALSDAQIVVDEINPENGSVLEALSPPAASIITATDTRMFLGGVAGDPNRVWYSRQRNSGDAASFNDGLAFDVPQNGGDITAVVFLNDTLCVFRKTSIHAFGGDGFDNGGGGQNFGPARIITSDVGALSAEAVVLAPMGLIFKSAKGWYMLDAGWNCKYIGAPVAGFDSETVLACQVVESQHQIRALTASRMMVWDYLANQWGEWTISDGLHAVMWKGQHVYLTATGPSLQQTTYTALTYGQDVELTWVKGNDLQGMAAVRQIEVLGEFRSACLVRVRVARDYQYDGAGNPIYYDDFAWTPSPTVVGNALQVRHTPSQQKLQAIKVRLTAVAAGFTAAVGTLALNIFTSGSAWSASFRARAVGTAGNVLTLSTTFIDGTPFVIDVRDHFIWNNSLLRWTEKLNNIGILVTCRTGSSPTVAQLEAAIIAQSSLVTLFSPDSQPTKVINATGNAGASASVSFSAGTYTTPTGEAFKLTGLALEVGAYPSVFKRLPATQKV